MKINRRLNLALTLEREGGDAHVFSEPVGRAVYESNFELINSTVADMYGRNWAPGTCARSAFLMLKKVATEAGNQAGADALVAEIVRLSNVLLPSERGWETVPLQVAMARKLLDEDEVGEVLNSICYFTAASWFHKRRELEELIYPMLLSSGGRTGSWDCTGFAASLTTSTTGGDTTATAIASPIIS